MDLLRAYACDGDDGAFAALFDRHAGWIFAAAKRRVGGDEQLADDVTQAVFIVLAEKASKLAAASSKQRSLSAWLFHTTRLATKRALRTRTRQARRESAPHLAASLATRSPLEDATLLLLLEDAIAALPRGDRELILRRFYGGEMFEQIARSSRDVSADA